MTEFVTQVVRQGETYRVSILPISRGGTSPYVAASWAEEDGKVFESHDPHDCEALIGRLSDRFWSTLASHNQPAAAYTAKSQTPEKLQPLRAQNGRKR